MTTTQQLNEARASIQTRVENYPIQMQGFMQGLLWEREMVLLRLSRSDWAYPTYYDLLLDLAGEPRMAPIHSDDHLGVMEERLCYSNCHGAVMESGNYTYVEGYAQTNLLLVQHAWLEDAEGTIIDPTWANLDLPIGFRATYFGVKFTDEFLFRHTASVGWHSFFASDWQNNHEILRRGLKVRDGIAYDLGDPRD